VLDTVGPGRHGHVHRGQAVRVRGHRQADRVRLPDHHAHLVQGELAQHHLCAGCRESAAGHDLDDVDAAVGALSHGGS
jgi:hypothetical protein